MLKVGLASLAGMKKSRPHCFFVHPYHFDFPNQIDTSKLTPTLPTEVPDKITFNDKIEKC